MSKLNAITIGKTVKEQLANDHRGGGAARSRPTTRRSGWRCEAADNGTRDLLEKILKDEEAHLDWLEAQRDQIEQMGLENYLANQA